MTHQPALLALADGSLFRGLSIGAPGETVGEVVFNTSMTGYQEILSDPSYSSQIVTLTYPHIGNVGVNAEDMESAGACLAGLIIREPPRAPSNWRAEERLDAYLHRAGIVAIADIDTRRLTRLLREKGAQNGCIMAGEIDEEHALAAARAFAGLEGMDLARQVGSREIYEWRFPSWVHPEDSRPSAQPAGHVVLYDFGVKHNIARMLVDRSCRVTVVPPTTPAGEALALRPDGVVLANGPGDPEPCDYAIRATRELLAGGVPVFGICLGHQILGLAGGARTVKMKFGHHGANHPVLELDSGRVMISSQNHGFAVDESTLPDNIEPTHRSLFDGSLQGLRFKDAPAFGFQGHPEASPGPHDVGVLFDRFIDMIRA